MYLQERHIKLLERLEAQGNVSVAELSQLFQVSEVTIRNDLKQLAEQKLLIRTHGGAMVDTAGYLSMAMRQKRQVEEKRRIGQAAAVYVRDNEAVFLDSSSTSLAITQHILDRHNLTVITNGLSIVEALLKAPGITIILAGGMVRKDTVSIVHSDTHALLDTYNIQCGFFGAHGLSAKAGFTDVSPAEAAFKQPIIGRCRRVIALLDSTKWGKEGAASFASLSQIDIVISDQNPPPELLGQLRAAQVEIMIAQGE